MVFKKIIFQNRYVALETPPAGRPFMANTILNFHFDYLNPSLIYVLHFHLSSMRNTKVRYMITQDCYLDKDDYPRRRVVVRARREDQADYVHQRGKELTEVPKICLFQRLHRQYAPYYPYILHFVQIIAAFLGLGTFPTSLSIFDLDMRFQREQMNRYVLSFFHGSNDMAKY